MISGKLNRLHAISLQGNHIPSTDKGLALHYYPCEQMDISGGDDHVGFDDLLIHMTDEFQSVIRH